MRLVGLHHDGTARGQRRGGVAAGDGEGQGEIARAEDGDRTDRNQHASQVGPWQRLPVRQRGVNARIDPGPLAHHRSEQPQLSAGSRTFAGQPCDRQACLGVRAFKQRIA